MLTPSIKTLPLSARSNSPIIFKSVDLPLPDSPTKQIRPLLPNFKFIFFKTSLSYFLHIFLSSSITSLLTKSILLYLSLTCK